MGFNKAIFVFLGVLLLGSGLVMAMSNASVTGLYNLTRWDGSAGAPGSITTEGGNISVQNITATSLTDRWAGLFGNVSGTIYLTDSIGGVTNYLYKWAVTAPTGLVCVSNESVFDFSLADTTTAAAIDTYWGFGAVADSAANTFNETCTVEIVQDNVAAFNSVSAPHQGASVFDTCAIEDGTNYAFCTNITNDGSGYKSDVVDYELMVPVKFGTSQTEIYYFFAEITG